MRSIRIGCLVAAARGLICRTQPPSAFTTSPMKPFRSVESAVSRLRLPIHSKAPLNLHDSYATPRSKLESREQVVPQVELALRSSRLRKTKLAELCSTASRPPWSTLRKLGTSMPTHHYRRASSLNPSQRDPRRFFGDGIRRRPECSGLSSESVIRRTSSIWSRFRLVASLHDEARSPVKPNARSSSSTNPATSNRCSTSTASKYESSLAITRPSVSAAQSKALGTSTSPSLSTATNLGFSIRRSRPYSANQPNGSKPSPGEPPANCGSMERSGGRSVSKSQCTTYATTHCSHRSRSFATSTKTPRRTSRSVADAAKEAAQAPAARRPVPAAVLRQATLHRPHPANRHPAANQAVGLQATALRSALVRPVLAACHPAPAARLRVHLLVHHRHHRVARLHQALAHPAIRRFPFHRAFRQVLAHRVAQTRRAVLPRVHPAVQAIAHRVIHRANQAPPKAVSQAQRQVSHQVIARSRQAPNHRPRSQSRLLVQVPVLRHRRTADRPAIRADHRTVAANRTPAIPIQEAQGVSANHRPQAPRTLNPQGRSRYLNRASLKANRNPIRQANREVNQAIRDHHPGASLTHRIHRDPKATLIQRARRTRNPQANRNRTLPVIL